MANTVIQLRKASSSGAVPTNLANGELSLDHFTGNLWFKAANGTYCLINPASTGGGGGGNSFATMNVEGTLIVAASSSDVLNFQGGAVTDVTGFSSNNTITIKTNRGLLAMLALGQFTV
jgi:hypothetical protein